MIESDFLSLLAAHGALLRGHFILTSGLHSPDYVQSSLILGDPVAAEALGVALAYRCKREMGFEKVDCVVGPALGGVVLAFLLARYLGARAIFAERLQGIMTLTRGQKIRSGESVLVVEDAIITGGTVKEMLDLIEERGGKPAGVATLLDRSGGSLGLKVPFTSLARLDSEVYRPAACPLCVKQVPIVRPHHGRA